MRTNIEACMFVAFLGLAGCMMPDAAEKASARQKIRDGALVVDVRAQKDFAAGHIDGATNIPLREVEARLDQLGERDRPIVVHCYRGMMSAKAKETLQKAGFTDVTNAGGYQDVRE